MARVGCIYLSLSGNQFNSDEAVTLQLIQALKLQKNLYHIGMSISPSSFKQEQVYRSSDLMIGLFVVACSLLVESETRLSDPQQLIGQRVGNDQPIEDARAVESKDRQPQSRVLFP